MSQLIERSGRTAGARPEPPLPSPPSRGSSITVAILLALLAGAYTLYFGWLSLERYWAYEMHALDMGNMAQAAWNTIHGHPFRFTNMRMPYAIEAWRTTTRLSFHVEALFPFISLVYLVYPHPESLLILQTVALALGVIPVYLLARNVIGHPAFGLLFALLYLLFPTLEAMNLYEFHPVALATPLLVAAFLCLQDRRYVTFAIFSLAAMGTKEEIGLVVALFGLYAVLVNRDRRVGWVTVAVGVAWSLVAGVLIEKHFRQPGTVTYLHSRYGYLGHGIRGVMHTLTHDPGSIASTVFTWPKLGYLIRLLAPVGFTAVLMPLLLLLGAPTLLLNLFSTALPMVSGLGQDSAELISVVIIAGIYGTRLLLHLLQRWIPRRTSLVLVAAYLLIIAVWNQHVDGFTPIGNRFELPVIGYHQHLADRFVSSIPADVPVSTQDQLDPHLSGRRYLYLFIDTGREVPPVVPANYILLDASSPTYPLPSYQLEVHAQDWIRRPGWGVAAAQDGLILIERGARSKTIPAAFYSYMTADPRRIVHRLDGQERSLTIAGYDVRRVDLANKVVPNLAYTIYFRPQRRQRTNLQPVIYEVMKRRQIGCAHSPLGLAWLPTSRWKRGRTYAVTMDPLETTWQTPGTAQLFIGLAGAGDPASTSCGSLWSRHGPLWPAGSLDIRY